MFQLTLTTPLDPLQPGWSVDVDMQATVPVSGSTWTGKVRQYQGPTTVFQYSSTPEYSCDNSSPCWKRIEASWFPSSKPHYNPPRPLWSVVLCYENWELLPFVLDLLPVIPRESEFAQIILNIEEFFCSDVREAAIHFILVHALQQGIQCQRAETLLNLVPVTLDDFFSKQICLFVLEKASNHPDLLHHIQTWAPLDTVNTLLWLLVTTEFSNWDWFVIQTYNKIRSKSGIQPGSRWLLVIHPLFSISHRTPRSSRSPW